MISCSGRIVALFMVAAIFARSHSLFAEPKHPFTVEESIKMTLFSDPYTRLRDAKCKESPDGQYFLVVTTRGSLRTNQLVSSLWVYSAVDVDSYLHKHEGHKPKALMLFQRAGFAVAQEFNSYGSLITDARWSRDSKSILFLVEQPDGHRHLCRVYLSDRRFIDLTPGNSDIEQFSEAGGTIAWVAVEHEPIPKLIGDPINQASSDLTGLSLFHILFPTTFPDPASFWPALDLWVRYKGVNRQVNAGGEWHFPRAATALRIAVSPDGRSLIAARAVQSIPTEWLKYKTASAAFSLLASHTGTDRSGRSVNWPWQYIYVNLDRMTVAPLVDAPSGIDTGYIDAPQAVWSPDDRFVLFTNSYLPLSKGSGRLQLLDAAACAAAIYDTADHVATCVVGARLPAQNEWLTSARFGATSNEVILQWSGEGTTETDTYARSVQGWNLEPQKASADESQPVICLFIKQGLNEPPTLWAAGHRADVAKELWNPNPQLASLQLGKASVYMWKDSTGYQWHAGLVLPPNYVKGHRYPLVIQTHGFYNEHEFLVDGSYTTGFAARALAASGIIVLQMEDRADRHVRPAQQEAHLAVDGFKSAIDRLDKDGLIDRSHVGIIGFSRTAWYVEEALIHDPHLFRAATLIDGIDQSYMTYMLFAPDNPEAAVEQETANGGKPFGAGLESWVRNAPGFNLDKVQVPIRIEALGRISVLGEWEVYSSLYLQGKPVDLIYIPNGQHILQNPQERYASQQGNVDWFRFWLQGYEDPDPTKRVQYRHWESWRNLACIIRERPASGDFARYKIAGEDAGSVKLRCGTWGRLCRHIPSGLRRFSAVAFPCAWLGQAEM